MLCLALSGKELLPETGERLRGGVLVSVRVGVGVIQSSAQVFAVSVEGGLLQHDALQFA